MVENPSTHRSPGLVQILWLAIPLVLGILASLLIPKPVIGLIYLNDAIGSTTAQEMISEINYARQAPQVRAVVLVLNSPGGTVTDTESVYMELNRLRQSKPVVTIVEGMAASGAYYLAAGTDYIFAKPSSDVGNVGVIGSLPSTPGVDEEVFSTGPYKLWGSTRDTYVREMEMLKQGFLQAVLLGRGSRLKTTSEVILRGEIWPGSEALRMGLIDELGAQSQAIDKAGSLAHISHYQVEDLRDLAGLPEVVPTQQFYMTSSDGSQLPYPKNPGIYLLYIPPGESKLP